MTEEQGAALLAAVEQLRQEVASLAVTVGSISEWSGGAYSLAFWALTVGAAGLVVWGLWRVFREFFW